MAALLDSDLLAVKVKELEKAIAKLDRSLLTSEIDTKVIEAVKEVHEKKVRLQEKRRCEDLSLVAALVGVVCMVADIDTVTLGHHLMAYYEMLRRDRMRFAAAKERLDECPLGAAALAGTGFPINRDMTADTLGFSGPNEGVDPCLPCESGTFTQDVAQTDAPSICVKPAKQVLNALALKQLTYTSSTVSTKKFQLKRQSAQCPSS